MSSEKKHKTIKNSGYIIYLNGDNISESNSQVVSDDTVHSDLFVAYSFIREYDANTLLPLLALKMILGRTYLFHFQRIQNPDPVRDYYFKIQNFI